MPIFGYEVDLPYVIIGGAIILLLIILIIMAIIKRDKSNTIDDIDTREEFGDFHGLLKKEDFEIRCEDPMLELYRMNWIKAEPGDKKDNCLLLYLAMKQLNKEQDESENEWTQEECESRMDEIINELSKKTGIQVIIDENTESEYEEYFNEDTDSECEVEK